MQYLRVADFSDIALCSKELSSLVMCSHCIYMKSINLQAGVAGLLITGLLVRTHSGAYIYVSPHCIAWPRFKQCNKISMNLQKYPIKKTPAMTWRASPDG